MRAKKQREKRLYAEAAKAPRSCFTTVSSSDHPVGGALKKLRLSVTAWLFGT
jgi:hypothetical protein